MGDGARRPRGGGASLQTPNHAAIRSQGACTNPPVTQCCLDLHQEPECVLGHRGELPPPTGCREHTSIRRDSAEPPLEPAVGVGPGATAVPRSGAPKAWDKPENREPGSTQTPSDEHVGPALRRAAA